MDRLTYLKNKVIYYGSLMKLECPYCKKKYLVENKTQNMICGRCKKKIYFYKKTISGYDNSIAEMVMNCNDEMIHIRAIKLIKKMKLMNDKERQDFFSS